MTARLVILRIVIWLLVFLGLFSGALIVLFETGALTPYVVESLDSRLRPSGLSFRAGSIQWRPWSGLGVRDVRLETAAEPGGAAAARHLVSIRRIDVGYRLTDLLRGDLRVARLRILQPDIDLDALLEWSEASGAGDPGRPPRAPGAGVDAAFHVDDIAIADGRVRGRYGEILGGLTLRGRLEVVPGTWRLDVEEQRGHLRLGRVDEDVALVGALKLSEGIVHAEGVRIAAAGGEIELAGFADPRGVRASNLVVAATSVPLEKVGEWLDVEHPLLFARLDGEAVVTGRPDSLHVTAKLRGVGRDELERRIELGGVRTGDRVSLERFRYESGPSLLELSGDLDLGDPVRIEGVAVFRDLEPAVLLADPDLDVLRDLDGTVRFAGAGLTRATFRGGVEIHLRDAEAFGLPVESCALRGTLDRGALAVEEARLTVAGSELLGHGSLDAANVVEAELRGELADLTVLEQMGGAVRRAAPRGHGVLTVRVAGPVKAPELDAVLELEDASIAGLDASRLAITAEALQLGATRLDFRAEGHGVGRGERRIEHVVLEGWGEGDVLELHALRAETGVATLALAGRLDLGEDGRLDALVSRLHLTPNDGAAEWTNEGPVRVTRTDGSVSVTGLDLRGDGGSVSGQVIVRPDGATAVEAVGRAVDLALFAPFLSDDASLAGIVDFEGDAVVGADTLGADVRVSLRDGRLGGRAVETLSGRVLAGETLRFEGVEVGTPDFVGSLQGGIAPPPGTLRRALFDREARTRALEAATLNDIRVALTSSDFGWLWSRIPKAPVSGGEGTVTARLDGPFLGPTARLDARLTGGTVGSEPLDSFTATAEFDGETLSIRDGLLRTGDDSLSVSGTIPLEWSAADPRPRLRTGRPVDLRAQAADLPLQSLSRSISLFQTLHGRADARVTLTGEPGSLRLGGEFSVTEGRLTIPTFDEPLVDGTAKGGFDATGVRIDSARFLDGRGGVLTGSGRVTLADLRAADYAIDVTASEYHYRSDLIDTRAVGSGTMRILARRIGEGRLVPFFQGAFRVQRADLGPAALAPPRPDAAGPELPPGVVAPPELMEDEHGDLVTAPRGADATPATFLAEIGLRGDRNIWVKTPEMDLELAADVTFHAQEWGMGLAGEVRTLRGNYAVLNSRFRVDRAEVEFTDPSDPRASYIDAEASTTVLDENVTVYVTGPLIEPNIRLETESGMSEAEIYELLALRVKRGEENGAEEGAISDAFRRSYVAALTNRFGGELGRELGLDTFAYDEGEAGSRSSVTVGKNVGRDFFLKYRQAVGGGSEEAATDPSVTRESLESPERALTIEYRLNRIFMLQGETGTLPPGDDYLNVDLRAEWGY